ncbi:MAG: hypothetical protein IKO45_01845 [Clostridia bacterium]|jgi:hypothetical protein|nr:hypothetical protein [Clostridia bacterium]MBQ5956385.1 hypothetical protein [Clostridia bacterium]MBQ6003677.1 hypothetical protein [Clostridia bacterium]MBR0438226.1 hypothetical protein [Clostridia bacterium]MBR3564243.1 hypothetical protein [Clostridia bacterium]
MKLKEMLKENGCYETFDNMGFGAENVIGKLNMVTDEHYAKYEWIDGKFIVHAVPPLEMLKAGYPWEEWYRQRDGVFQHHCLFLEKTDKCDMTWDGRDLPAEDQHPEAVKGYFWYLYNDEDPSLIFTR